MMSTVHKHVSSDYACSISNAPMQTKVMAVQIGKSSRLLKMMINIDLKETFFDLLKYF